MDAPKPNQIEHIDLSDKEAVLRWCQKLGVSISELAEAVGVVGAQEQLVRAYLAGANTGLDRFVGQVKERIDEIEGRIDDLEAEREQLSEFLELLASLKSKRLPTMRDPAEVTDADVQRAAWKSFNTMKKLFNSPILDQAERDAKLLMEGDVSAFQSWVGAVPARPDARITDAVERLLKDGRRRKTGEILNYLEVRGYSFDKSKNAPALLSTLLSKDDRFAANRKDGWGLTNLVAQQAMSDLMTGNATKD